MATLPSPLTGRAAVAAIPHLAIGAAVTRYDLGDEIARRHGVPMVPTACGREITPTLTTRRTDLVRCAGCIAATTAIPPAEDTP